MDTSLKSCRNIFHRCNKIILPRSSTAAKIFAKLFYFTCNNGITVDTSSKTAHLLNISCIHYFRTSFTHSINNCGNIRCDILRNVYGHLVIAVDQSHAFRIFHSAFYFPHFIDTRKPHPLQLIMDTAPSLEG